MNLVFDTSILSCFSRANDLEQLELLTGYADRRVTTRAVIDELRQGMSDYPKLAMVEEQSWLQHVSVDGLDELRLFAEFSRRLVDSKNRNIGEASALAWAKKHDGTFLSDDQTAIVLAKEKGIEYRRTLALVADGVCRKTISQTEAGALVDELIDGGAHFPCRGGSEFLAWANIRGLFDRIPQL